MALFEEGNGGRPKGSENKVTKEAKKLFLEIMEGEVSNIKDALDQVRQENPGKYIDLLSKLMPYFMPKQVDLKSDGEKIKQVFKIGNTEIEF